MSGMLTSAMIEPIRPFKEKEGERAEIKAMLKKHDTRRFRREKRSKRPLSVKELTQIQLDEEKEWEADNES